MIRTLLGKDVTTFRDSEHLAEWLECLGALPAHLPDEHALGYFYATDSTDDVILWLHNGDTWLEVINLGGDEWAPWTFDSGPYSHPRLPDFKTRRDVLAYLEESLTPPTITYKEDPPLTVKFDADWDTGQTKDTPDDGMANFEGGGRRSSDEGKARFDLLLAPDMPYEDQILTRAAHRMAEGAKLYGTNNYSQMSTQDALDRAKGSLLRHTMQYLNGEADEDHLAAVVCNALMLSKIEFNMERED